MKKSTIALSLIAMFLSVGCSKKDEAKPAEAPAAAAAPAAKDSAIVKDVPAEIKDSPFEQGGQCAIDVVNNVPVNQSVEVITANRADGLSVDGWAFDEKGGAVPPVVVLQLAKGEERYYAPIKRHGGRDDLIKGFGNAEFTNAGYAASMDVAALPTGQYEIQIVQKIRGKNAVCSTHHNLDLKG